MPIVVALMFLVTATSSPQHAAAQQPTTAPSTTAQNASGDSTTTVVSCSSQPGERIHCDADTSRGVALQRSTGGGGCLLGKSWGYDDTGIWVSDGCGGEFLVGGQGAQQ